MTDAPPFDVVIPTIGRPSLSALLQSLASSTGPRPQRLIVVDDRRNAAQPLAIDLDDESLRRRLHVVRSGGCGPAAARNAGWQESSAAWIAFLDDDVVVDGEWFGALARDLAECGPDDAGTQGRIEVPLPPDRRPTDWERNVAGLATSQWITADCAYRRDVLAAVGGFDTRFRRAYREDADLGLRVVRAGWKIRRGTRRAVHPVRLADPWISVRLQAGNADDVLMDALHGPQWPERAGAPRGRLSRHVVVAACGAAAVLFGSLWAAGTLEFAWRRIAPGPRTPREIATMLATSAAIPFAAVAHRLRGRARVQRLLEPRKFPAAVLLDRDGTIVVDVPYNRDPSLVRAMPGARAALDRLRAAGVKLAVITNQSGLADGRMTPTELAAVNKRVDELVGPLGPWFVCPHGANDGCACRKPKAGLIIAAARALGVDPRDCVVIGDIGADVEAARNAGAESILVPTGVTRPEEIAAAPRVAASLAAAVDELLGAPSA